jgi:hypothetical protein
MAPDKRTQTRLVAGYRVGKNYLTTLFGIMAGVPAIIANSGFTLTPLLVHILAMVAGVGVLGLGLVAKDWNTTGNGIAATKTTAPKGFIPSGK